jgi:CBS domain-containing protein
MPSSPDEAKECAMLVRDILQEKGRDVATVAADATLSEAAQLLAGKRIGALVVQEASGGLSGILSERDIVRAVAEAGVDALGHRVSAHMTHPVETCAEQDTVEALMETMTNRRLRHLPVVEQKRLCGIVSIGDVVKIRIAETIREAESLRGYIATA